MTIDPPDDLMEKSQESLSSPIVINDKMLSHSAMNVPSALSKQQLCSLLTPSDMELFKAIQQGVTDKKVSNDPYTSYIDSDSISSILMDLNEQDYEVNIPVNELLKMM